MKKTQKYIEPEIEIITFTNCDVITTSVSGVDGPGIGLEDDDL